MTPLSYNPRNITAQTCQRLGQALVNGDNLEDATTNFNKNQVVSFIDNCLNVDAFGGHYYGEREDKREFAKVFLGHLLALAYEKEDKEIIIFDNQEVQFALNKVDGKICYIQTCFTASPSPFFFSAVKPQPISEILYEVSSEKLRSAINQIVEEQCSTEEWYLVGG